MSSPRIDPEDLLAAAEERARAGLLDEDVALLQAVAQMGALLLQRADRLRLEAAAELPRVLGLPASVGQSLVEVLTAGRVVTALDFEAAAMRLGTVGAAKAFTRVEVRRHSQPGEVEVVLVPQVPEAARPAGRLPASVLHAHEVEQTRGAVESDLRARCTIGTRVVAGWAEYTEVVVRARVVVRAGTDVAATRERLHRRLREAITPLPAAAGSEFGQPLLLSTVQRLLEDADPAVQSVESVSFAVADAPDTGVRFVAADPPGAWFAAGGELLFGSTNDTTSWGLLGRFPGEDVRLVRPAPATLRSRWDVGPGAPAVVGHRADGGSIVRVRSAAGGPWRTLAELEAAVIDLAWVDRDQAAALLLATDTGLVEISLRPGAAPVSMVLDTTDSSRGVSAVVAVPSPAGRWLVVVALQARAGVWISDTGTAFRVSGLNGVDIRTLAVQVDGTVATLWAGLGEADPRKPGLGCARARLFDPDVRWEPLNAGWTGGSCWSIAFAERTAVAGTQSGGVLTLDTSATQPQWLASEVSSGLPLRDRTRFEPVLTVAVDGTAVLAGGPRGVFRSTDLRRWLPADHRQAGDQVVVASTGLLCSGEHDVDVVVAGA